MGKRITSAILFLVTLGLTIWQTIATTNVVAILILGVACLASLLFTIFPFLKWGCRMIRFLWKMWRHPIGLFVQNISVSFVPCPSEGGGHPEWICGLDIISVIPWSKEVSIQLEIREPRELAGTTGNIKGLVNPLGNTPISPTRFPISEQAAAFLKEQLSKSPGFLPLRILINIRDAKGKPLVTGYSINHIFQY
jgi:hypothetical protein